MLSGLIARVRSLVKGITSDPDTDMQAEFAHHMALRARDLVRSGLSPEDAVRQARVEFGGTYNYKKAGREARTCQSACASVFAPPQPSTHSGRASSRRAAAMICSAPAESRPLPTAAMP